MKIGSLNNKIVRNYLYNVSYQIVMTILPLITIPYLTRTLGASVLGIFELTQSVVQMLIVFGLLGMIWYANRAVAYCRDDPKKLSACFLEIFFLRLLLMCATILALMLVTVRSEFFPQYRIYIVYLVGTFMDISWFFSGIEELRPVVIRNYIIRIISTALLFILIRDSGDLNLYLWLNSMTTFCSSLVMLPFVRRYLRPVPLHDLHVFRHVLPALALFLPQAASQIYVQCDKILIRHLIHNTEYISFYAENEKIAKMPIVLATALSTVLMPRIANEFANGNRDNIRGFIRKALVCMYLILAPCCAGLMAVAKSFVPVFLGAEFTETYRILMFFCPIMILIGFSNVTGIQYLVALDRTKELTASYISAAAANLVLDFALIPVIGVYGAIAGTLIAEFIALAVQYYYMRRDLGRMRLGGIMMQITVISAAMCAVVSCFNLAPWSAPVRMLVQIPAGVAVYGAVIWKTGLIRRITEEQ